MWGFVIWQIFNFLLILRNPRTVCSKHIVAKALNIVKRKLTHHMRIEICSHINLFFASLVSCFYYKILHIYIRAIQRSTLFRQRTDEYRMNACPVYHKMILQLQEQKNAESASLDLLLKEKAKIETSLANLVGAIEKGIIFDTTAKRIKELESRQKEIEIKITKEKSKKTFKLSRRNITTYFAEIFLSFFYEFYNRLDILKRMRMMIAIGFGNDRYR